MTPQFKLMKPSHRHVVLGRTGSGKSQYGAWTLSCMNFDKMPWVVVDYKHDALFNSIERIRELEVGEVPKHPGLYIVHPLGERHKDAMENWLWKIHARGNTGLFFDEGYMLPDKGALQAVLTQGRSLRIPAIILSQRPVWMNRFCFSEANQITAFHLNDQRDQQTVQTFTPKGFVGERLPEYHSRLYDVDRDLVFTMLPVPEAGQIVESINARLLPTRRIT
jgi:hypothetical protein